MLVLLFLFALTLFSKHFDRLDFEATNPFLFKVERILMYGVVLLLSIIQLSKQIFVVLRSRVKAEVLFAASFLFIILFGAVLLGLPNATYEGISFTDALFTSTSAVCVTGLTVVDTGTTFTLTGQVVLLMLIQVGGIGVMTFTSFFAMFILEWHLPFTISHDEKPIERGIFERYFSDGRVYHSDHVYHRGNWCLPRLHASAGCCGN